MHFKIYRKQNISYGILLRFGRWLITLFRLAGAVLLSRHVDVEFCGVFDLNGSGS